jgi:hypothetical protein
VGDWIYETDGSLLITVSDMGNEDYEALVEIHERIEALLCRRAKIKEEAVTAFDMRFEANRRPGDTSEPGDSKKAPYRKQHQVATMVEKIIAAEAGIVWDDYERTVNAL